MIPHAPGSLSEGWGREETRRTLASSSRPPGLMTCRIPKVFFALSKLEEILLNFFSFSRSDDLSNSKESCRTGTNTVSWQITRQVNPRSSTSIMRQRAGQNHRRFWRKYPAASGLLFSSRGDQRPEDQLIIPRQPGMPLPVFFMLRSQTISSLPGVQRTRSTSSFTGLPKTRKRPSMQSQRNWSTTLCSVPCIPLKEKGVSRSP